ncbi:hypothetical protein HOY82DRAFT_544419, partial [Tuber indicum]
EQENQQLSRLAPALLSLCGSPDYSNIKFLDANTDIKKLNFLDGYSALNVQFNLPGEINFPPIPVSVDKNITVYPLQGESLITGLEYLSAKNILNAVLEQIPKHQRSSYFIKVVWGSYIPFNNDYKPFENTIKDLQENRRLYKKLHGKKSAMELIYKDLGNMLYGKTVMGLSNKRKYDARTRLMKSMAGTDLSNPIIGAWITGFVRSLLAELLYNTQQLGGTICSVTTDGFVCDIENLEDKINSSALPKTFLTKYRDVRESLSKDPAALEVKTSVVGLVQWSTRNQLSKTDKGIPIAAMTGFQKYFNTHKENL